ncbi:spore germination protein [Bacillus sp. MUM 116]|uniref:spore germination protein n=1 Tax=Bacillus sp. MUM 116 TaxID=1678002 RepID=UPI0008F5D293|nr:spore germination protein [Bacillus sp. MUM 116]OIK07675.1 spore germination protein [Bacillus sp. MUM 116]
MDRKLNRLTDKKSSERDTVPQDSTPRFTDDLELNLELTKQEIGQNWDVHYREFNLGRTGIGACLIFVDGLSDKELINKQIISSLMVEFSLELKQDLSTVRGNHLNKFLKNQVIPISEIEEVGSIKEAVAKILTGSTALIVDGSSEVLILGTTKLKTRSIEEPVSEALVRGPRIGFTESLRDNTSLMRGNGEVENLTFVNFRVGKTLKKDLVVAYIKGIVDPELVQEVEKRIQKIDLDNIPESGYVEQLIEDNYRSPFPQAQNTERPDRVMAGLMEGRVAILLDGTPFALIVPVTFSMMLQSPEDYYERWIPGTFIRLLRYLAATLTLFTPALYIAFISFHPGMIPTKLAISIIGSRSGVPFPALIEALFMEIAIEILREAGLRLPKPIGPAMGIVGGLIIGEAAVQAGIVSPILVIIVSLTAISSFAIPQYSAGISLRILRFIAMFFSAVLGLYGVILFFLFLTAHLVKLKSFGTPYVSPAAPYRLSDWKDFMFRMPLLMMKERPKMNHPKDKIRKG